MNEQLRMFEKLADDYANEVCFDSKGNLIPELCWSDQFLIKFAELVRANEREACAKVCEIWGAWNIPTQACAAAIRARGEVK